MKNFFNKKRNYFIFLAPLILFGFLTYDVEASHNPGLEAINILVVNPNVNQFIALCWTNLSQCIQFLQIAPPATPYSFSSGLINPGTIIAGGTVLANAEVLVIPGPDRTWLNPTIKDEIRDFVQEGGTLIIAPEFSQFGLGPEVVLDSFPATYDFNWRSVGCVDPLITFTDPTNPLLNNPNTLSSAGGSAAGTQIFVPNDLTNWACTYHIVVDATLPIGSSWNVVATGFGGVANNDPVLATAGFGSGGIIVLSQHNTHLTVGAKKLVENSIFHASGIFGVDTTPPTITGLTTTVTTTTITFSEPVDGTFDAADWIAAPNQVSFEPIDGISPSGVQTGITSVVLTHPSTNDPGVNVNVQYSAVTGDIQDQATTPNVMTSQSITALDGIIPVLESAKITGGNQITFVFSENVLSALADFSDLKLLSEAPANRAITGHSGAGTPTTILTFAAPAVAVDETATIDIPQTTTIVDNAGNELAAEGDLAVTDGQAPTATTTLSGVITPGTDDLINDADDTGTLTVTVTYDELMNTGTTPDITFSVLAVETGGTLTETSTPAAWSTVGGVSVYTTSFTVDDVQADFNSVIVTADGATDVAGNDDNGDAAPTFEVDMLNPTMTVPTLDIGNQGDARVEDDDDDIATTTDVPFDVTSADTDNPAAPTVSCEVTGTPATAELGDAPVAATGTITLTIVSVGDIVTINGLDYTAISGSKDGNNAKFDIDGIDAVDATDLADSITNDARVGTVLDVIGTSAGAVVTAEETVGGTGGNAITLASSDVTRLAVSGATLTGGAGVANEYEFDSFSFIPGIHGMTCVSTDSNGNTTEDTFDAIVTEILFDTVTDTSPFWLETFATTGTAYGFLDGESIRVIYGADFTDEFVIEAAGEEPDPDPNAGFTWNSSHQFSFGSSNTDPTIEVKLFSNPVHASAISQQIHIDKHFTDLLDVNDIATDFWGKPIFLDGILSDRFFRTPSDDAGIEAATVYFGGDGLGNPFPMSTTTGVAPGDVSGFFRVDGNSVLITTTTATAKVTYLGDTQYEPTFDIQDYTTTIHPTILEILTVPPVESGSPATITGIMTDDVTKEIVPGQIIKFLSAEVGIFDTTSTGPVTVTGGFSIAECITCAETTLLLRVVDGDSIIFGSPGPEAVVMPLRDMAANDIEATVTAQDGSVFPATGDGQGDNTGIWSVSHGSGLARIDIDDVTGDGVSGIREIELLNNQLVSLFSIGFNDESLGTPGTLTFDDVNFGSTGPPTPGGDERPFTVTASSTGDTEFAAPTPDVFISTLLSNAGAPPGGIPAAVIPDSGIGITSVSCTFDTDGDALCDDWEGGSGFGVPYETPSSTTNLFELTGTTVSGKDLLLEIDSHAFHVPAAATLTGVSSAFSAEGINLITAVDDTITPDVVLINVWTDDDTILTNDFSSIKAEHFGTSLERVTLDATGQMNDFRTQLVQYKLDSNILDTSLINDGILTGSDAFALGQIDNAFEFDGATFITTPNLVSDFDDDSVTVSVWFNTDSAGVIVDERGQLGNGWQDSQLEILSTGEVKARVWNLTPVSLGTASFGEWHHAVLRYDDATDTLDGFLDGVKSASSGGNRLSPYEFGFGIHYSFGRDDVTNLGGGATFTGLMDDARVYNFALEDAQITDMFDTSSTTAATTADVAYEFDADDVTDSVASNDGSVTGTDQYDDAKFDRGFDFDGSTFVSTPNIASLFADDSVTLSVWFKTSSDGIIVDERGQTGGGWQDSQIEILSSGEVKVRVWPLTPVSLGTASFGEWHHAILRYDGTTNTLDGFLDGVKSTASEGDRQAPYEFGFGMIYSLGRDDVTSLGGGLKFTGLMDDFRVYTSALTDDQVNDLAITNPDAASLVTTFGLKLTTPADSVSGDETQGRVNVQLDVTLATPSTFNEDLSGTISHTGGDVLFTFDSIQIATSSTAVDTVKSLGVSIPYSTTTIVPAKNIGTITIPLSTESAITAVADSSASASSTRLDAKAQAYRYILFTHSIGGQSGQAELRGNDAIISLGDGFSGTVSGHTGTVGTVDQQSGTLLHELGHLLNLNHGGPRYLLSDPATTLIATVENCVPFQNSVMSYTGQFPTYKGGNWVLDFSSLDGPTLNEVGLDEDDMTVSAGLAAISGSPFILWSTPDPSALQPFLDGNADGTNKDWLGDGDFNDAGTFDLNDFGIFGCKASAGSLFEAHSEWANLDFDFRQGPTGQFDASFPQIFPPGQAEPTNVGVRQQIINNYQTNGVISPTPDGFSSIGIGANQEITIALNDRAGDLLENENVFAFVSFDGGVTLQRIFDVRSGSGFFTPTIEDEQRVFELVWNPSPTILDLPTQGTTELESFLYIGILNVGATPNLTGEDIQGTLVFDRTSSTNPDEGRETPFVFTDGEDNRATLAFTLTNAPPVSISKRIIDGETIQGDVLVAGGQTVEIKNGAVIEGSVIVEGGTLIVTSIDPINNPTTIKANIDAKLGSIVTVQGSVVEGDIKAAGPGGSLEVTDTTVKKNVDVVDLTSVIVTDSTVLENIKLGKNGNVTIERNTVTIEIIVTDTFAGGICIVPVTGPNTNVFAIITSINPDNLACPVFP